ncbi:hypothetical protein VB264_18340 [Arcicella aquatica]|uniref:Uncharacterized protein n=1 Tax=Arcicella aquatica TaxID=217141 RepID=A0ABU5QRP5_9BACT|nr:hypothetical protein [Arcicella aquatica]MEA5259762.1 hypothetical protein [Arcicella aquatica]
MINVIHSIKAGMTVYKVVQLLINDAYDELGSVYINMADSHFKSAEQSFKAYYNSNDPNTEIRLGINHLRDSYNIYYTAIRRSVEKRLLIFWTYNDFPYRENKTTLLVTNIAAMISLFYKELGEFENAKAWKIKALDSFEYYSEFYKPDMNELKAINSAYVIERKSESSSTGIRTIYLEITDIGKQFVTKRLNTQKDDIDKLLSL